MSKTTKNLTNAFLITSPILIFALGGWIGGVELGARALTQNATTQTWIADCINATLTSNSTMGMLQNASSTAIAAAVSTCTLAVGAAHLTKDRWAGFGIGGGVGTLFSLGILAAKKGKEVCQQRSRMSYAYEALN